MTIFLNAYRKAQSPEQTHFCPGCGHGSILKFVDEAVSSLSCEDRTIWVSPVGCGGLTDAYLSVSHVLSAHGRASAVATAVKRIHPEAVVIASQGDGDLASIGIAEAIHAAARGENITVIFINNANFGMTGGQMAPTSLEGQHTPTSPEGRMLSEHGAPLKMCELLNTLDGPAYIARVAIGDIRQLNEAHKAIRKAIENQIQERGYSFVEVLSPCPSNWHCSPQAAREQIQTMCKTFPTGTIRDVDRSAWVKNRHKVRDYTAELTQDAFNEIARSVEVCDKPAIRLHQPVNCCCAGFGGQGVLSIGRWLSHLALVSGLNDTWIPSYGPEMRGGVANCFVRISKESLDSPVVSTPSHLVAMNQPSLDSFLPRMQHPGVVLYDCDVAEPGARPEGIRLYPVAASSVAQQSGAPRCANCVMLGALLRTLDCDRDVVIGALRSVLTAQQVQMVAAGLDLPMHP